MLPLFFAASRSRGLAPKDIGAVYDSLMEMLFLGKSLRGGTMWQGGSL